eukprot:scaffold90439_cov12-Tisochrysis_lutea.AAC.1
MEDSERWHSGWHLQGSRGHDGRKVPKEDTAVYSKKTGHNANGTIIKKAKEGRWVELEPCAMKKQRK